MSRFLLVLVIVISAVTSAPAQTSAGYKLTEYSFNNGGDPLKGSFSASSSYRVRLDAIGSAAVHLGLSSSAYRLDGGFVAAFPPPGEVLNQRWTSDSTMVWDAEKSVGSYDIYRDLLSSLPGTFGICFQSGITTETASDPATPHPGDGWFYLVTARNSLTEEGTKGFLSNGMERSNLLPCP